MSNLLISVGVVVIDEIKFLTQFVGELVGLCVFSWGFNRLVEIALAEFADFAKFTDFA